MDSQKQILHTGAGALTPQPLASAEILRGLNTQRVGRSVLCFGEVGSTNDIAWDSAIQSDTDGLVILAEFQRAGRGRHGKRWISTPGAGVLMSTLLLDPEKKLPHEALTVAAGLAVAQALARVTCLEPDLKWPNDVLISGRKIAGIIVERRNTPPGQAFVIGLGLNISEAPPDEAVDSPATSLAEHLDEVPSRAEIVRAILQQLDAQLAAIVAGELDALHEAWLGRCNMLHERITVDSQARRYVGRVLDVDPLRGMLLADDHGSRIYIPAAGATIVAK